jgi:hypothetical protein
MGAGVDASEHVEDDGFCDVDFGGRRRMLFPNVRHAPFPVLPYLAAETLRPEIASGLYFGGLSER